MFTIDTNTLNGTIVISDKFNIGASASDADATPYINNIGEEYTISFTNIQNVSKLTKFTYDTLGMTDTRYLAQYYRLSRDGQKWTTWFDLKKNIDNFPTIDPLDPLYLDIKWVRKGNNSIGSIRILEYSIEGVIERPVTNDGSAVQLAAGDSQIIKPPFIYKVFKLEDVEVISSTGVEGATLKWRYSQDSSRTWSDWEILTKENVSTKRLTPTRFFEVEYSIENTTAVPLKIQDINLIGNFQNVTLDYQKTNLYGLRECCQSNLTGTFDANGNFIPNTNLNSDGSGSCESTNLFPKTTADQQALLYNPYNQGTALNLLNKLSTDAQLLFGHAVIYFVTDPDAKGQDYSMHEYQLYNIVCEGDIKVSVNNNEFPDSQIQMNQFDLSLFDNMEVHITKEQFKQVFGVQRKPGKEDFMYFCQLNRMFQVDHVSQFRGFNNSSVYYKLILKKYNQKANVQAGTLEIQNKLDMLTQNSTIDSLFGVENVDDKKSVANKVQTRTLTKDLIRLEYLATIDKELIENSSTIISKSNYDLFSVDSGTPAVNYFNSDPILKVSDNIGFTLWFSINNYIQDEVYNFFNYYDDTNDNPIGWKVNLVNDVITVTLNGDTYTTNSDLILDEEVWYCYTLNVDQRNRKISQFIYKRNVDFEEDAGKLTNNFLRKVYSDEQDMTPIEFQIENTNPQLLGSDMKATNLRLFTDIIPESTFDKILNQAIIRDDSKYLVFADNANTRLVLPSFPLFE
jgi:hypothetical protein